MRLLVVAWLAAAHAVDLGKTTYNLNLIVEAGKDTFEQTRDDAEALLKTAVAGGMGTSVQLLLRSAVDKVKKSLLELEAKQATESATAEMADEGPPKTLTNTSVGVRALKSTFAKPKKANAMKRISVADFTKAVTDGKAGALMTKPLIVEDGVGSLDELRSLLHAEALMGHADVTLEYFTPAISKQKRSFDDPSNAPQEWEHNDVSVERYFVNCFNLRAKPDFRKRGGAQTEHCEQDVAWSRFFEGNATNVLTEALEIAGASLDADLGRTRFLLDAIARGVGAAKRALASASTRLVIGPAGAGEHLRQQNTPIVDGLVHGERRWFTMQPDTFMKLRSKAEASGSLEPSSAFVFFESQLEELIEDQDLGSKKLSYREGSQKPGDVVFIPPSTIFTALTYSDAASVRGAYGTAGDAANAVDAKLWAPEGARIPDNVAAAACYGDHFDTQQAQVSAAAAGLRASPAGAQVAMMAQQLLPQIFPTAVHRDALALGALADCAGFRSVSGSLGGSQCRAHAGACARTLGIADEVWVAGVLA